MKGLVIWVALLIVAGCASQPVGTGQSARTGGVERYECYTYVGSRHVLTLPVPGVDTVMPVVQITFHGD